MNLSSVIRKIYKFLSSVKLAMVLLITILACCVAGVTIWRGAEAGRLIFGTLWFNGILSLLVVNVAFCFFPRMWGRRLTLVSFGMILFHLSFVAILGGIVFNSLFYFRGTIRISEGETLSSGDPKSYDFIDHGHYFSFSKLKGETTFVRMHPHYKVDGEDKRAAYEIEVGEGFGKKHKVIYITNSLDYNGFRYLNDREGYSILVILYDKLGKELYGVYAPLQSLKRQNGSYLYTTGTRFAPESYPFPQPPAKPIFNLQVTYLPSKLNERDGEAFFQIFPLNEGDKREEVKVIAEGKAAVGDEFDAGEYRISVREVRYWVAMNVRYEPGKPIVLTSLWIGFGGIVITFIGRIRRVKK